MKKDNLIDLNIIKKLNDNFITQLEIILYSHNYIDNLLITRIKSTGSRITNKIYSITRDEFLAIINEPDFRTIIESFKLYSDQQLYLHVNSVYFINEFLTTWVNLKTFRVNISNERNYTRVINNSIMFTYKIKEAVLNLSNIISDISDIKHFLFLSKIWNGSKFEFENFYVLSCKTFIESVLNISETEVKNPNVQLLIDYLLSIVNEKIESDNPTLYLLHN